MKLPSLLKLIPFHILPKENNEFNNDIWMWLSLICHLKSPPIQSLFTIYPQCYMIHKERGNHLNRFCAANEFCCFCGVEKIKREASDSGWPFLLSFFGYRCLKRNRTLLFMKQDKKTAGLGLTCIVRQR